MFYHTFPEMKYLLGNTKSDKMWIWILHLTKQERRRCIIMHKKVWRFWFEWCSCFLLFFWKTHQRASKKIVQALGKKANFQENWPLLSNRKYILFSIYIKIKILNRRPFFANEKEITDEKFFTSKKYILLHRINFSPAKFNYSFAILF